MYIYFFFQAEDGIRDRNVTGVQTCALPISEISLKNDKFSGTLMFSVDFSLLPTLLATKPEIRLKNPVGWPIKKESSSVTAQIYFRMIQGINDQYRAEKIAPRPMSDIPDRPASTPAATNIKGNHHNICPVKKIVLTFVNRAISR